MVEDDRYCIDVLTQITAIQAALDKVALACSTTTPATAWWRPRRPGRARRAGDELMGAVGGCMRRG